MKGRLPPQGRQLDGTSQDRPFATVPADVGSGAHTSNDGLILALSSGRAQDQQQQRHQDGANADCCTDRPRS